MSAPPRKSLSSQSWRRPCLPRCPCGVPSPKHLDPRDISLLACPRARGASCPLHHLHRDSAYPQACHPGGVTEDELGSAQLRVSTLQAPQGQWAELLRMGATAQLSQVAFGDAAQELSPTFLGTGTPIFT